MDGCVGGWGRKEERVGRLLLVSLAHGHPADVQRESMQWSIFSLSWAYNGGGGGGMERLAPPTFLMSACSCRMQ